MNFKYQNISWITFFFTHSPSNSIMFQVYENTKIFYAKPQLIESLFTSIQVVQSRCFFITLLALPFSIHTEMLVTTSSKDA